MDNYNSDGWGGHEWKQNCSNQILSKKYNHALVIKKEQRLYLEKRGFLWCAKRNSCISKESLPLQLNPSLKGPLPLNRLNNKIHFPYLTIATRNLNAFHLEIRFWVFIVRIDLLIMQETKVLVTNSLHHF